LKTCCVFESLCLITSITFFPYTTLFRSYNFITNLSTTSKNPVQNLFPGYFAIVMATGIISIAAYSLNMAPIAYLLLWLNIGFYSILIVLLLSRILFYFSHVVKDITDHQNSPGFLTLVAGSCILGTQMLVFYDNIYLAKI